MFINEDLPYKEKPSSPRNGCQLYATIKTPKPSQIKVRIMYSISGILELWKFSNLTFGGYLAGTTPVLSARSLLFLFRRFCLEHVRTVWLIENFWHHHLCYFLWNLYMEKDKIVLFDLWVWNVWGQNGKYCKLQYYIGFIFGRPKGATAPPRPTLPPPLSTLPWKNSSFPISQPKL